MFNSKRKSSKSFLSLGLISIAIAIGVSSSNPAIAQIRQSKPARQNIIQTWVNSILKTRPKKSLGARWVESIWKRRPKRSLGARSSICPVAPGLIETYTVWHDKPLFLWHTAVKNRDAQLIVRERQSEKPLWVQKVNIGDKKVFYSGQPLQPGKLYQWKLSGTSSSTPWINFQIMSSNQRSQIQAELQGLEQKSLAANNSEEIAIQKAEYFFDYAIDAQNNEHLWADGLQALYQVEKPSSSFIDKRNEFVANICTPNR